MDLYSDCVQSGASKPAPRRRVAVVGLGTVGLPVALAFARRFPGTLGFDRDAERVRRLRAGVDPAGQVGAGELRASSLQLVAEPRALLDADFFVVAVATRLTPDRRPDLRDLEEASRVIGAALRPGAIVVYESTVVPGTTEEVCGPILERASGLRCGADFTLGYSPERVNPGDPEHGLERVVKVVAAQDARTLDVVARCYEAVVEAGVHRAPSIRVAETAKLLENAQRDLNIALCNELAQLCTRLGVDTQAVLDAASTKWNFARHAPGLVGGPCLGLSPHYLAAAARQAGMSPRLFLAGRRVNDAMAAFVAEKTREELEAAGLALAGARVAVLGLSFKENVADLRGSRAADLVSELCAAGAQVLVHDPLADRGQAAELHGIELVAEPGLTALDAVILAVPHRGLEALALRLASAAPSRRVLAGARAGRDEPGARPGVAVLLDLKAAVARADVPAGVRYWRL
ncbi:MAG: nucleotide sugar dehydrogenase [Planctomycetota bacterium]|nr:MAG: nucleotide sugar dehydrogenase [Planctomycetota bacterium]